MSRPLVPPGAVGQARVTARHRTVPVLAAAQVLGGVGVASGIAVNGLLAQDLSGSSSWAGLAQTMGVIGAAVMAVPLARLATARGRRPALAVGYALGVIGALLSIAAAKSDAFWLLLVGAALFGGGTASGLQARYAAIDGVPALRRGRSLSLVVWATTIGSVAGPNLSGAGGRLGEAIGLPALAGPYLFSVAAFAASTILIAAMLRPDPLHIEAALAADGTQPDGSAGVGLRAAAHAVASVPAARLALVAVGTAHAVMVAVMVMTPVHLHDGGATLEIVGVVLSVHIAGMYALSPVFGLLSDRLGRRPVIGAGVALLAVAVLLAGTAGGHAHVRLGVALTVLGLGWSACVVAGSTLLSESVPSSARTAVQGLSDLVMGLTAAVAGALAGPVLDRGGYAGLNALAAVLLVPVTLLVLVPARPPRPA